MTDSAAESRSLAQVFADMARDLDTRSTVEDTLDGIVRSAVATLDGCDHAGISLVQKGREITTPASTDPLVVSVDEAQYQHSEGPCLSAIWDREQRTFVVGDLSVDGRWPAFAESAVELGVRSMMSFQLFSGHNVLGALNLYSGKPEAFDDHTREMGDVLAAHAAVALAGSLKIAHLSRGIQTRQLIGEACGILMERHRLTSQQAFQLMSQASQDMNVKLRDIAEQVVRAGIEPADADVPR